MDENRAQVYLQLINALLTCPSGEEPEILNTYLDLVDVGFVKVINQFATQLNNQGNLNYAIAIRLQNIIKPLVMEYLEPKLKAYSNFLMEKLPKAIAESTRNPAVAEPFLVNNSNLLDQGLADVLRDGKANITSFDSQTRMQFGAFINEFGVWMMNFSGGKRANNLEISIAAHEVAATAFIRDVFPDHWASALYNLGNGYRERLQGEKANNLEWAINSYKLALEVSTPETPGENWRGEALNNLGVTYYWRIEGDKEKNLEDAIFYYKAALNIRTREAFISGWAQTKLNLGNAYRNIITGDKSENLELAIGYFKESLKLYDNVEVYAKEFAESQHGLGRTYRDRIEGNKSDNLELAINCYKVVLEVQSTKISAQKRADIQHSMGVVYEEQMKGSKAENLETAIKCYEKALEGRTFETSPQNWAETKYQLGSVYCDRIWGERAKNLALAIQHLSEASKVRTFENSQEKWANTQNALANAYRYLIKGNKAENFKLALSCYEEALKVRTPESSPKEWSRIKYNIGVLYLDYIDNFVEVVESQIFISSVCSDELAYLNIYSEIHQAIENLQASLKVRTPDKYPIERAESLNILGTVYIEANYLWKKLRKVREINQNQIQDEISSLQDVAISLQPLASEISQNITIEKGIKYLIKSLNTINFQDNPQIWGENNINLAYAYLCLKDLPENQELVIASYKEALKGFTQKSFPHDHLKVQYIIGQLYQKNNELCAAYSAFAAAIDTVELLRNEINYVRDESKDKLAEKWNGLYQDMVKICLELKKYTEAIEYVERSKSRNLVELLANSEELYPKDADDSLKQELRRLRSTTSSIRQLLAQTDNKSTFNRDSFQGFRSSETSSYNREYIAQQRELLQEYQRQLDEVFAKCQQLDPAFTLTQEVKPITVAEIRDLIDSHTAILEWYIGTDSFQIFIVTQSNLEVVQFDKAELEKLEAWNQQYLEALFNDTETWQDNLSESLNSLSQILRLDEILNHPALANCDSLILVPHRYLHLFPLHALSVSQQTWLRFNQETPHLQPPANPCLLDCFKKGVRYAPSCQLLQRVQARKRPPTDTRTLFAIQNPTEDLAYTDIEVEVIKQAFTPADILSKQQATKTALIDNLETIAQAHYVHFSCHGSFDFQTPLFSSLILAGAIESTDSPTPTGTKSLRLRSGGQANPAKCLTLQDIFATLNLPKCRLVTLSACETGLTDTTKQSDDCIGLATGFLYAGSQGVLSSLWSVDDFATAYLMIKFYENLATADMAVALNTAQIWLRDANQSKLLEWIGELKLDSDSTQDIKGFLESYDSDEKPFESPVFWAAFCAIGK